MFAGSLRRPAAQKSGYPGTTQSDLSHFVRLSWCVARLALESAILCYQEDLEFVLRPRCRWLQRNPPRSFLFDCGCLAEADLVSAVRVDWHELDYHLSGQQHHWR